MPSTAITEAIQLLVNRRDELIDELIEIDAALTAMKAGPDTATPGERADGDAQILEPTRRYGDAERVSVRLLVQQFMEGDDRTWLPAELVDCITDAMGRGEVRITVKNLGNAVRTALWGLRQDDVVRAAGDHRYVAAKWVLRPNEAEDADLVRRETSMT